MLTRDASLQVAAENVGALALYAKLGFRTELFRYQYRRRSGLPDRAALSVKNGMPQLTRGHSHLASGIEHQAGRCPPELFEAERWELAGGTR